MRHIPVYVHTGHEAKLYSELQTAASDYSFWLLRSHFGSSEAWQNYIYVGLLAFLIIFSSEPQLAEEVLHSIILFSHTVLFVNS